MNLANKLTLTRIGLTFVFMLFLFMQWPYAKLCALFMFLLASVTDYYDGKVAKQYNIVTDFGKLMDPIADKVLVLAAFLAFVELKIIPAWMVVLIISRELIITGMRVTLLTRKKVVAATKAGKHKTVSQMLSIFVILIYLSIKQLAEAAFDFPWWNLRIDNIVHNIIYVTMVITVALTLTSGISYLKNNIKALR